MQSAVQKLLKNGPLPSSANADEAYLELIQNLMMEIELPISDAEAKALLGLFGPDDCFGLAWTLVHIIETSPRWPLHDALDSGPKEWAEVLRQRSIC
jgi:hypothetical protein